MVPKNLQKIFEDLWKIMHESIMLPSIFEKHKICSNRTKSLLIDNQSNIFSNKNEDFAMERRFVI